MPVPDFQTIMLPLLRVAGDGKPYTLRDGIEAVSTHFKLTEADRAELLPSGRQPVFDNRVGWARTYLTKAGLLLTPKRGVFQITPRGVEALRSNPARIDIKFLDQFPEFIEFRRRPPDKNGTEPDPPVETDTPVERLEKAYVQMRAVLEADVLERTMACSPAFFERLVVELLVKMGYGGSFRDASQAIGKSGDGGIDGTIKEDRLGLDVIYVQAKRWQDTVGRPEIQKFAGALQGNRAVKGVFITTSAFSRDAVQFAAQINSKIALIGGKELAALMIDHGVGVSPVDTYEIKRIDSDYFVEE